MMMLLMLLILVSFLLLLLMMMKAVKQVLRELFLDFSNSMKHAEQIKFLPFQSIVPHSLLSLSLLARHVPNSYLLHLSTHYTYCQPHFLLIFLIPPPFQFPHSSSHSIYTTSSLPPLISRSLSPALSSPVTVSLTSYLDRQDSTPH